jgi:hypothetical protein
MKLLRILGLVNLLAVMLFLSACNSARQVIPETIIPEISNTATTAAEVTADVATPTITEIGGWNTYQNTQAGYSAEYPADWMVSEQVGTDGSVVTIFSPIVDGAGIMVLVQSGEFGGLGSSDIPNTRCEEVSVGGVTGLRCFDTINFATSTTVVANGQTFTIASLGKRIDESIYSRFLSGFQIIR